MAMPWYQDPATIIGALGLLGGVVGWVRSVRAGAVAKDAQQAASEANLKAADAQADATAALERSADANDRIAKAVEILAQIASDAARRTSSKREMRGVITRDPSVRASSARTTDQLAPVLRIGETKMRDLVQPVEVKWRIEQRIDAGDTYRLRNDGTIAARAVHLEGIPEAAAPLASFRGNPGSTVDEIEAGSAVVFGVEGRLTLRVTAITVRWSEGDSDESKSAVLPLP